MESRYLHKCLTSQYGKPSLGYTKKKKIVLSCNILGKMGLCTTFFCTRVKLTSVSRNLQAPQVSAWVFSNAKSIMMNKAP